MDRFALFPQLVREEAGPIEVFEASPTAFYLTLPDRWKPANKRLNNWNLGLRDGMESLMLRE